jgi:hypothetical protein
MSSNTITIKPNNHRAYQCPNSKKIKLIDELISKNQSSKIVVVCSQNPHAVQEMLENKTISVIEDKEFITSKDISCEILISYDIPDKAIIYTARVSKATSKAFVLVDKSEQKKLYPIEMLLGRAIKQEIVSGFEYEEVKKAQTPKHTGKKLSKDEIKAVAKKRYEEKTGEPKPKQEFKKSDKDNKWAKNKKAPNKFLGKDENGKAIFSGKSGERNHRYDGTPRDKYDTPKKVGRKINIKAIKPKKES